MEFLLDSLFTFATSFEKKTVGTDQKKARLQGVHRVMGIMGNWANSLGKSWDFFRFWKVMGNSWDFHKLDSSKFDLVVTEYSVTSI